MIMDIPFIDAFLYNGEPIASLRLELLYNVVQKFIIVESKECHSGLLKDDYFFNKNKALFEPYMDKIEFIGIDRFPETCKSMFQREAYMQPGTEDSWARERYQRNMAFEALEKLPGPYIALVCDVDEIPNPITLRTMTQHYSIMNEPIYFEMDMFYYNFEWKKSYKWYHAYCISDKGLVTEDMSYFRTVHPKRQVMGNAGWHCSWFFPAKDIIRKLESFAHQEFNRKELCNETHIMDCIRNGKDLLNRSANEDMSRISIDRLPIVLGEFHDSLVKQQ